MAIPIQQNKTVQPIKTTKLHKCHFLLPIKMPQTMGTATVKHPTRVFPSFESKNRITASLG